MKNLTITSISAYCAVIIALALLASCNSSPTHNTTTSSYAVAGSVIADANNDSTKVLLTLRKDQVVFGQAIVRFNADTLKYRQAGFPVDSVYSLRKASRLYYGVGKYKVIVADSTIFIDSANVRVTDTFTITSIVPANRLALGLRTVSLQWTGADSTDGYILAATPRDSAYKRYGKSLYPGTLATAGSIPPGAFGLSSNGVTPDTGWYYLYVYAYTGVPDSATTARLLPVPLPSQLADNLTTSGFTGHVGTVRVVKRDSVHVVTN